MKLFGILMTLLVAVIANAASTDYVGEITQARLLEEHEKFARNYASYQPSEQELEQIKVLAQKDILIMFGTWCHDSKREVPRFLKLLDTSQVPLASLTLQTVDRDKNEPTGVAEQNNLKYTPTFVVFENKVEVARIIEKPQKTLARDFYEQLD